MLKWTETERISGFLPRNPICIDVVVFSSVLCSSNFRNSAHVVSVSFSVYQEQEVWDKIHGLKVEDVFVWMSGLHPSGCCGNCGIRVQLFVYPPFLRTARTGVLVWRVRQNVRLSCTMMSSTHSRCCSSTSPRPSIHPHLLPPPSLLTWTKGTENILKNPKTHSISTPSIPSSPIYGHTVFTPAFLPSLRVFVVVFFPSETWPLSPTAY